MEMARGPKADSVDGERTSRSTALIRESLGRMWTPTGSVFPQ
jgi:hypothetical protein